MDNILPIIGSVILAVLIAVGSYFMCAKECDVQAQSFKSHDFNIIGGCMVETKDGRILPLKNYRGFE